MSLAYPYPIQSRTKSFGALPIYGLQQDSLPVGAMGANDMTVLQHSSGTTLSVDVNAGVVYVPFGTPAAIGQLGGLRRCYNDAVSNSGVVGSVNTTDWSGTGFTTPDASNPRIDSIYLQVRDSNLDATGHLDAKFTVVTGTATSGATLDNRTGAGAAPSVSSILLADILMSAGMTGITTAKIRDRRPIGPNVNPPLFDAVDQVTFEPVAGAQASFGTIAGAANAQAACAMWLPRRIVGATKIRWAYKNTSGPETGSWIIAICDASGRPIVYSGTNGTGTAVTGAASALEAIASTITATTFEAGMYWVALGHTFSASPSFYGIGHTGGIAGPNIFAYASSGGLTIPATIAGFTDAGATPTATQYGVPVIALSVG